MINFTNDLHLGHANSIEFTHRPFSGQELLDEFKTRQAKVRPAVEALLEAAKAAALGTGEYSTLTMTSL